MHLALQVQWPAPEDQAHPRQVIEAHFQELFAQSAEGFRPLGRQDARELLITWETAQGR